MLTYLFILWLADAASRPLSQITKYMIKNFLTSLTTILLRVLLSSLFKIKCHRRTSAGKADVHAWMSLSLALVLVYPFQITSFGQTSPETHQALCMGGQTNHLTSFYLKQIHGNRTPADFRIIWGKSNTVKYKKSDGRMHECMVGW